MREIIFRGKRIDNGEWVEGGSRVANWGSDGNKKSHTYEHVFILRQGATIRSHRDENNIQHLDCQVFEVIPKTVGQYTGLEDKNGKKIFEGDIIGAYGYDYDEPSFDEYGEVVFTPLGVAIYIEKDNGEIDVLYLCELQGNYSTQYEKFGNIHDNPELLK